MKIAILGFMVSALLSITGCAPIPKPEPKIVTEYIVVSPSKDYIKDATIVAPPDPNEYAAIKDPVVKEARLFQWANALIESIGEVNRRLDSARREVQAAEKTYESKKAATQQ